MNNKKHLLITISVIFLFASCVHEEKIVEETYPDGSPKRECIYMVKGDSKDIIKETTYYPGKKVQMSGSYKNKKRDGNWIYYYSNGKIWSEGAFKDGKSEGRRVMYNENGTIHIEGYYKDDYRTGVWKFYDEKGSVVKMVDYTNEAASHGIKPGL